MPKITFEENGDARSVELYTPEGFELLTRLWVRSGWQQKISYEVAWLGIPVIQMPEDLMMLQELIWKVRPDVIVETGTAHGGTAVFFASILELLKKGRVISIDVEIRKYNRLAIQSHPVSHRIALIEGSSSEEATALRVRRQIYPNEKVMVMLDSNHSYAHVARELELFSPLVSPESYLAVFDGVMESISDAPGGSPAWATDNPAAAVRDFLRTHPEFEEDRNYNRMKATYAPGGFLKRKEIRNSDGA